MQTNPIQILDNWRDGLIREPAATIELEAIQVRGEFRQSSGFDYIGYDYANQKWITYSLY